MKLQLVILVGEISRSVSITNDASLVADVRVSSAVDVRTSAAADVRVPSAADARMPSAPDATGAALGYLSLLWPDMSEDDDSINLDVQSFDLDTGRIVVSSQIEYPVLVIWRHGELRAEEFVVRQDLTLVSDGLNVVLVAVI